MAAEISLIANEPDCDGNLCSTCAKASWEASRDKGMRYAQLGYVEDIINNTHCALCTVVCETITRLSKDELLDIVESGAYALQARLEYRPWERSVVTVELDTSDRALNGAS
jgi:hypothetical protein